MNTERIERNREGRLRHRAVRFGYRLSKSRRARTHENLGGFMVIDKDTNFPSLGFHYDATLDDIEGFLAKDDTAVAD